MNHVANRHFCVFEQLALIDCLWASIYHFIPRFRFDNLFSIFGAYFLLAYTQPKIWYFHLCFTYHEIWAAQSFLDSFCHLESMQWVSDKQQNSRLQQIFTDWTHKESILITVSINGEKTERTQFQNSRTAKWKEKDFAFIFHRMQSFSPINLPLIWISQNRYKNLISFLLLSCTEQDQLICTILESESLQLQFGKIILIRHRMRQKLHFKDLVSKSTSKPSEACRYLMLFAVAYQYTFNAFWGWHASDYL